MALFSLPSFNLFVDFWAPGNNPASGPADLTHQPAQLYYGARGPATTFGGAFPLNLYYPMSEFRMPGSFLTLVTLPMVDGMLQWKDSHGNQWPYRILWWDWDHAGFANEYIFLLCEQVMPDNTWPASNR